MLGGNRSLISDIYEAAVIHERWPQVLDQISVLAGAEGGFIAAADGRGERSWLATDYYRPVLTEWYEDGWHRENPWIMRGLQRKRLQFFDEHDIFAPGEVDSIPMYRDFHRPRGGGWSAGAIMKIPSGGLVCMRFERRHEQGVLDPEGKARLNQLRSHLARASLLFTNLAARQARSTVSALQFMDVPAAVLTRNGRLLACNQAMETRLSQVHVRAGNRVAFTNENAQRDLSENLERITFGLFDQLRGPISLPATEEHGPAVAYLIPMRGAAQDLFGCESTLLMIRPAESEHRLMDLVRTRFAINAGEAQRWARRIAATSPRLAAALLASAENVQTTLDRALGHTQNKLEARMASLLYRLGDDPEYSFAGRQPTLSF
ncbi:hypothetical protein MHY87_00660 [Microvirga sp. ACRRW]|uniref:hypothetical protein n=1 Tax=Microvirga sp. ACRRW TaxID=2918205 RepID=UPI001EF64BDC|nr:hypothetical protein [Microvirga sp. ACRRW]MCG7391417.1 hypothetical protein [Microvirga sp. ACRRW]